MTTPIPDEDLWPRLSRILFGASKTADGNLFTYRVMREIRQLDPLMKDAAWHRFLRLAVPLLGAAAASLFMSVRAPTSSTSMDTVLFQRSMTKNDPLSPILEGLR